MKHYFVYILASGKNGTLYIGVTSDLVKRVYEHRNKLADGFTTQYNVTKLVHFEILDDIEQTIRREKQLKAWHRNWKIDLVEKNNAGWSDLYKQII